MIQALIVDFFDVIRTDDNPKHVAADDDLAGVK